MTYIVSDISYAASLIRDGQVVAFPTETVYGLGANATDEEACMQVFTLKNRPLHNPLIIHVRNLHEATMYGVFNAFAYKLADAFWPGPLTLVLHKKHNCGIANLATSNLKTIAIRVPRCTVTQELLRFAQLPIAAPSANRSNYISGTTPAHIARDFMGHYFAILSTEPNKMSIDEFGIESTIVDCTSQTPAILRHGAITHAHLTKTLDISLVTSVKECRAPGMFSKHYAPQTHIRLNAKEIAEYEIGIDFGQQMSGSMYDLSPKGDLYEAAKNLYSTLRMADQYAIQHKMKQIAVSSIPIKDIGIAINDRLVRASYNNTLQN